MNEQQAMRRALRLAWRGWGRVHPNPLVGAVILRDGSVIGEGWHAEFGGPHAEPLALAQAGERARGATLVVTLEPCRHQGKQPPCTRAVQGAGIARVVMALDDPNPEAGGGGVVLESSGVQVERGLESDAAAAQNAGFLHRFADRARPWVALKLATSTDSRIADAQGRSQWISGPEAREWVHWLRAGFDGIAVGAGTVALDDPSLSVRGSVVPRVPPARIIFDDTLATRSSSRLVETAAEFPTILLTSTGTGQGPSAEALRRRGVEVLAMRDLQDGLRQLRERGIEQLLVEGGGRLGGALLEARCVDRFYHVQSPLWLGQQGRAAFAGIPSPSLPDAERWRVVQRRALGHDTLIVMDRP
jgi:diaminohydroxyphosphoribosylaminopyrimidine deaminase/5-amino-6-(5-phosphoribosylamino)uracil reductase